MGVYGCFCEWEYMIWVWVGVSGSEWENMSGSIWVCVGVSGSI